MLVTSMFSFSHNVFYTIKDRNYHLCYIYFVVCKYFEFGQGQFFVVWEWVNGFCISHKKFTSCHSGICSSHLVDTLNNSLQNKENLDCYNLEGFTDENSVLAHTVRFIVYTIEKQCGERRNCLLPVFSLFPMFSKSFKVI